MALVTHHETTIIIIMKVKVNNIAKCNLRVGCWNVRSLLSSEAQALVASSLHHHAVELACLSEHRFSGVGAKSLPVPNPDNDLLRWDHYELLLSGRDQQGHGGVGFALAPHVFNTVLDWGHLSDRVAWIRIASKPINVTIICVYAPTNDKSEAEKDAFYEDLNRAVARTCRTDLLLIGGDFNAQVGPGLPNEGRHVGHFGLGTRTDNGDRLVSFARTSDCFLASTNFKARSVRHNQTWVMPDGTRRFQLDHFLIRSRFRGSVTHCRAFWGTAHCSDHALLRADVKLRLRAKPKPPSVPKFDVERLKLMETANTLNLDVAARLWDTDVPGSVDEAWNSIKSCLLGSAQAVLGRKRTQRDRHWMSAETLRYADACAAIPRSDVGQRRLHRANLRALARRDQELHWTRLATDINDDFERGDSNKLFKLLRTVRRGTGKLSDTIVDDAGNQVSWAERLIVWRGYFERLLNGVPPPDPLKYGDDFSFGGFTGISDDPPSTEEIVLALQRLKDRKAAGPDSLPAELFKACSSALVPALDELFLMIWSSESIPNDWQMAILSPVFKKGCRTRCSNYRGISLLCVGFKLLESIILRRMAPAYEPILRENQAGFRAGRGCIDQIFALRLIIETRYRHRRPTYVTFIDFKAAFDTVDRASLWHILRWDGVPDKLLRVLRALYARTSCVVRAYGELSAPIDIATGVRQGALLSPLLFNCAIDWVLRTALSDFVGVHCLNGDRGITDLDYADDIAIIADCPNVMQDMLSRIMGVAARVGLRINVAKTKLLVSGAPPPVILANGTPLEVVDRFQYLGAVITPSADPTPEIQCRIARAWEAFDCLNKDVWRSRNLSRPAKFRVFDCVVRNVLLYGCETWPEKVADFNRLEAFQMRCYRRILGITYRDRVTNAEVLRRAGRDSAPPLRCLILARRLRWLGHVLRLDATRPAHRALCYSAPANWNRRPGRRANWVHTIEEDLVSLKTPYRPLWDRDKWSLFADLARDRTQWKTIIDSLRQPQQQR